MEQTDGQTAASFYVPNSGGEGIINYEPDKRSQIADNRCQHCQLQQAAAATAANTHSHRHHTSRPHYIQRML